MKRRTFLLFIVFFMLSTLTYGDFMREYSLDELVRKSSLIVRGKVIDVDPNAYNEMLKLPFTLVTMQISHTIIGQQEEGSRFQIALLGGFSPKGNFSFVAGAPIFIKNEEIVVFARSIDIDGFSDVYGISAFSQSKFQIIDERVYRIRHEKLPTSKDDKFNVTLSVSKQNPLQYSTLVNCINNCNTKE